MSEIDTAISSGNARPVGAYSLPIKLRASTLLGIILLVSLVIPTLHPLPASLGPLDRSLEEFWDFALIGIWLFLCLAGYTKSASIRPLYLRVALWLPVLSAAFSMIFYALVFGMPTLNDVYAITYALRPIVLIQTIGVLLWRGRVGEQGLRRVVRLLVLVVSITLILVSLVAILQALRFSPIFEFTARFYSKEVFFQGRWIQRSLQAIVYYNRVTSIFPWANHYGIFTAISLLYLTHYFLFVKGITRYLTAVPIVFGISGLILSGSRTAFLVFVTGILLTLLIRRKFRLLPALALGTVLVMLIFTYASSILGQNPRVVELVKFIKGEGPIPETVTDRLQNYSELLSDFFLDPQYLLFGKTPGVYHQIRERGNIPPFDSEYIKNFLLFGVLGLASFVLFQLGLVVFTWKVHRSIGLSRFNGYLAWSLFSIYIPLVAAALVQDIWQLAKVMHLLFIPLGILLYSIRINRSKESTVH